MSTKLDIAVHASEKVRAHMRAAQNELSRNDTHVNGYGALMKPGSCKTALLIAIAELKSAVAIIDETQWLTDDDYDRL